MTENRRKDDRHPDRPLDWSDTETLAGQQWRTPASPSAAPADRDAIRDNLLAALKDVCDAAQPVSNAAYNLGQSHEQWGSIRAGISNLDKVRSQAYEVISHLKSMERAADAKGGQQ